jgi:uncharacterized protein involved in tolerance to divalent cations
MPEFYKVEISAEDQTQAETILNSLLEKKLVTGGQFMTAPARFLWKGTIHDMAEYVIITSFTIEKHKAAIIEDVRRTSVEEVPMIVFLPMEVNDELRDWIKQTVRS